MKVELVRYGFGNGSTLGRLYIDGVFQCYTLEDAARVVKVDGQTCIPEGTYALSLRTKGSVTIEYMKLYPTMHRGMLWLVNVPDFEYVYLHRGNTPADTKGCLLVGLHCSMDSGEFVLQESAKAYELIYPRIVDAITSGRGAQLTVTHWVAA